MLIRSTKSEKMYPSMMSRGQDIEIEPYYCLPVGTHVGAQAATAAAMGTKTVTPWSQPTSPTPPSRFSGGPLSPTHAAYRLTYPKKNDDGKFLCLLLFDTFPIQISEVRNRKLKFIVESFVTLFLYLYIISSWQCCIITIGWFIIVRFYRRKTIE